MNSTDEVVNFIRHFKGSEDVFLHGCCYWFALILHERFGLEIVYEPIEGHFLATKMFVEYNNDGSASYRYRRYDIRGDVSDMYRGHEVYSIDWLKEYEPTWYDHIMRDCRDFLAPDEHEIGEAS